MSKQFPHQKWPLPETVDPTDKVCYQVSVPNDRAHIGAFLGALAALGSGANWADDPLHKAREVAAVWREISDNLVKGSCTGTPGDDMQFRQNGCKLEYSVDCTTWLTLYDPSDCIRELGGQQGPGGTPGVGDCVTYNLIVRANERMILPIPVQGGNTITVTDMTGGASDGTTSWNCPDGTPYVLGACVGLPGYDGGDPLPTAYHMALIGITDDSALYDFSTGGTVTIPGGVASTNLVFQVNDSDLSNNSGSYSFKVEVCNIVVDSWTQDFNFALSDGGWFGRAGNGTYHAGVGWKNGGTSPETLYLDFTILHDSVITAWSVQCVTDGVHQSYTGGGLAKNTAQFHSNTASAETPGGVMSWTGTEAVSTGDLIGAEYVFSASPLADSTLTVMHLEGTGRNPFIP